ncbi:MAG: voltage-gated chloride channel [Elusimicrobia bacterium CG08_land_8_20_14_0_20_59_10]|nr:MAG: voltage-gated chloride channel [Elusimicrobia bacterium CG08_land_8_20_14_0_20_59_10]
MKTRITESTLLFISIAKWVFLATLAGIMVGATVALFLKALRAGTDWAGGWEYTYLLMPAAFFLSALMVKYLAPDAKGHGTEKVIEAVHRRAGRIPLAVVPVKLAATLVTLIAGGSAGKEGPCAQIGAGITSAFSEVFRFNDHDRKKMVICGISAGFAAVFGTPIAGAIFGVEVLFVGTILYEVLLPSFIAGITAYQVSTALGITYFYSPLNFVPVFSEAFLLKVMLAGIFCGFASLLLVELLKYFERRAQNINIWAPARGLIGGSALALMTLLAGKRYLGLGLDVVEQSLRGVPAHWYDFFMKSVFTAVTLSFGGSGGIITPIFFIGAAAGSVYAGFMRLDHATFSAIGMMAVLAGAANTPIAASIMAIELFGPAVAPYATVACVISFLMTGNRSVYPSQVLSISKSDSIKVELGKELQQMKKSSYAPVPGGLGAFVLRFIQKVDDAVNSLRR